MEAQKTCIVDDSGDDYLYPPELFDIVDDQGNGDGDRLQLDIGGTSFLFELVEIGSCNTKDYTDLDYWLVIKVEIRNRFVHYRCQGEYLEYRDIISIRDNLSRLLSGQLSEMKELSFTEPDFELAMYPKDELNKRPGYWRRNCRDMCDMCVDFVINFYDDGYNGESYVLPLDEDEIALFHDYLDKAVVAFDARNMTNKSIKEIAYCTKCYSAISEQPGFETNDGTWTCAVCGQLLYGDEIANVGNKYKDVIWYCDGCGAILNRQIDFDDSLGSWECTECGFRNSISSNDILDSE